MKKEDRFTMAELKKKLKEEIHHEYSSLTGFLAVLVRTLNPLSYKKLAHGGYGEGLRFYFHLCLFSFVVFLLFSIPFLFSFYDQLTYETQKLQNFSLTPQLAVDETIEFEEMKVVIANEKSYEEELLLVTQDSVSWRNKVCLFVNFLCFLYDEPDTLDFSQAHEIVEDRTRFTKLVFSLLLLMLPGILLLLFIFLVLKFTLVVALFFLFGYSYCVIVRYEIHIRELLMISIYSLSLTVFVETVFSMYYNTYYIPYLLSFILFMIATYLVSEKPFHHFKHGK